MYFHDASCHVKSTMQKTRDMGIYQLLGASWAGIIVITKNHRVSVEGECYDFAGIGNDKVFKFLQSHASEIYASGDASYFTGSLYMTSICIRRDLYYSVFTIVVTPKPLPERDWKWFHIYNSISYENVLLNNEVGQERELIQKVFESASTAILTLNLDGQMVTANTEGMKLLGLSEALNTIHVSSVSWLALLWDDILNASLSDTKYALREHLVNCNDEMKILNLVASPLRSNKGQVQGVVITCSDDTEKVLLEREVEQLNQFAILGEISAGVAHDVRNPLMNIRCSTQFLQTHYAESRRDIETLNDIIHEVDRINEVVEQMLTYSVIKRNRNEGLIDINEVIRQSVSIVKRFKGAKDIRFIQDLDSDVPIISGSRTEIQQALINLLMNAVQAIAAAGTVQILSQSLPEKKSIRIIVEDTGEGIPYDLQGQLFNRLFSTKPNGIGIGLSIVKRVISSYSGQISVLSTPGVGTSISILLPTPSSP